MVVHHAYTRAVSLTSLTWAVRWSGQAILILAAVAGECSVKYPVRPASSRAALTASQIAKKTDEARNRGGSPTA